LYRDEFDVILFHISFANQTLKMWNSYVVP
jgi:hypothetical protein